MNLQNPSGSEQVSISVLDFAVIIVNSLRGNRTDYGAVFGKRAAHKVAPGELFAMRKTVAIVAVAILSLAMRPSGTCCVAEFAAGIEQANERANTQRGCCRVNSPIADQSAPAIPCEQVCVCCDVDTTVLPPITSVPPPLSFDVPRQSVFQTLIPSGGAASIRSISRVGPTRAIHSLCCIWLC